MCIYCYYLFVLYIGMWYDCILIIDWIEMNKKYKFINLNNYKLLKNIDLKNVGVVSKGLYCYCTELNCLFDLEFKNDLYFDCCIDNKIYNFGWRFDCVDVVYKFKNKIYIIE